MQAIGPYLSKDKGMSPEQLEQYFKAAEGLRDLKID